MTNYVVKGESLTAVADAIREKTGTTEPLGLVEMPEAIRNIQAGDDDGSYDQGFVAGKQAEYDAFWDAFQLNGTRRNYPFTFAGSGWTDSTFNPKYPIVITNMALQTFLNNSQITTTKVPITVNTSDSYGMNDMFNGCPSLKTIPYLKITENVKSFVSSFYGCRSLEEIGLTEDSVIAANISFSACTMLTHDSLMSILNCLEAKTSGTWTVALGATNLAKLTDAEKAIALGKGWI